MSKTYLLHSGIRHFIYAVCPSFPLQYRIVMVVICYCRQHVGKHRAVWEYVGQRAGGVPVMPGMERQRVSTSRHRRRSRKPAQRPRIRFASHQIPDNVASRVCSGRVQDGRADGRRPVRSVRVLGVPRRCVRRQRSQRNERCRRRLGRHSHWRRLFATSAVPDVAAQVSAASDPQSVHDVL